MSRRTLILVPLVTSGALVATLLASYLTVRDVLETLVRGQGDAILDAIRRLPEREPDAAQLQVLLDEQRPEGLRCIVVFSQEAWPLLTLGECRLARPEALREALLSAGSDEVVEAGERVRMARGVPVAGATATRPPLLVEFEPLLMRQLEAGALRSLGIGAAASLALVAVGVGLWRLTLREERLKAAMERDRRLASLGEMAAVLAHEIRNPLASMKGHAQLLVERLAAGTPEAEKAERVVKEAVRLERLSGDLLSFVRTEQIERRELDPRALLAAAREELGEARVELSAEAAPESWPLDGRLIQRVLVNLLRNALDASPDGAAARASVALEDGRLVFTVRDHGAGLDAGELERMFEPFHTTRLRGTGLGLAVSRRIVAAHGGRITAANHPQGGALFRVELPRG